MRLALRALALVVLGAVVFVFVPTPTDAAPPETYTVQAGDTLYAIALRYHTTVAEIKKLNGLGTSDTILVGQKLLIPTANAAAPLPAATSYVVQPDDTLYRIALRYGTTIRALEQLNDLPNPNLISAGQALAIPTSATVAKPGLILDPPTARQGGTLLIRVARPDLASVAGMFNGEKIAFIRAAGYWYALVGISRCAKIGSAPLSITTTDATGKSSTDAISVSIAATAFPVDAITLPPSKVTILQDQALIQREAAQLAAIVAQATPTRLWSGAFQQPLSGRITENFGTRRSYNGGPVGACGHEGTDFGMAAGSPIYAPARGRVVFAGLTQVRGNMTVLDHGLGVFSAYYHQLEINVQVGQMVEPGTLIGKVGTTGLSTGNHLHWSMWVNGEYVDPMEWTRRIVP